MNSPSITDWLQTGGSICALVLASISLIWQAMSALRRREKRIRLVATDWGPHFWSAEIRALEIEPNTQAKLDIVCETDGVDIAPIDDIPHDDHFDNQGGHISRPAWGRVPDPVWRRRVVIYMHHQDEADTASGALAFRVGHHVSAKLRIKVLAEGHSRPLLERTLNVCPVN